MHTWGDHHKRAANIKRKRSLARAVRFPLPLFLIWLCEFWAPSCDKVKALIILDCSLQNISLCLKSQIDSSVEALLKILSNFRVMTSSYRRTNTREKVIFISNKIVLPLFYFFSTPLSSFNLINIKSTPGPAVPSIARAPGNWTSSDIINRKNADRILVTV